MGTHRGWSMSQYLDHHLSQFGASRVGRRSNDPTEVTPTEGIAELPDASGSDCAFLCLIDEDGQRFERVFAAKSGFAGCSPEVLEDEPVSDWPWP